MSEQLFKVGDRVAVMNQTLGGRIIFEGWAIIKKVYDQTDDGRVGSFRVKFETEESNETYQRNVHRDWQADPEGFVASLNQQRDVV